MQIVKGSGVIAELPDKPKDFVYTNNAGIITLETPTGIVNLGKYTNASAIVKKLLHAYIGGQKTFNLPDE